MNFYKIQKYRGEKENTSLITSTDTREAVEVAQMDIATEHTTGIYYS